MACKELGKYAHIKENRDNREFPWGGPNFGLTKQRIC